MTTAQKKALKKAQKSLTLIRKKEAARKASAALNRKRNEQKRLEVLKKAREIWSKQCAERRAAEEAAVEAAPTPAPKAQKAPKAEDLMPVLSEGIARIHALLDEMAAEKRKQSKRKA